MSVHGYTRYRSGRFHFKGRRRVRRALQGDSQIRALKGDDRGRAPRVIKWLSTAVLVACLGIALFVGARIGYGYLGAWAGQDALRDLFSITGNGSVDPGYLEDEAFALRQELNHLDPVGEINIPGIGSRWMIVEGADDEALTRGPGHLVETPLPGAGGNFTVAGDRVLYGAPFLHLDEMAPGDIIKVKMPYATFTYRVRETFIVTPEDMSVLEPVGYEAITLLTCDPPWDIKRRIVVRGELERVEAAGTEI